MRPNIENIRGLPDFMTTYNWNVVITKPPVGVVIPPNFNFQAQTATLPTATNQPIEVDIRGHKVRQAGIQTYDGTLDLQLVETVDTPILNFIRDWREQQWRTVSGVQATRENAKADFQLQLNDRQDNLKRRYNMRGGILTNYTTGDLAGDTSDALKPTLTITYDYFTEE